MKYETSLHPLHASKERMWKKSFPALVAMYLDVEGDTKLNIFRFLGVCKALQIES